MSSGSMNATTTLLLLLRCAELVVLVRRGGGAALPLARAFPTGFSLPQPQLGPNIASPTCSALTACAPAPRDRLWMCSVRRCLRQLIHTTPGTATHGCPCRPHSPPRRTRFSPRWLRSLRARPALALRYRPGTRTPRLFAHVPHQFLGRRIHTTPGSTGRSPPHCLRPLPALAVTLTARYRPLTRTPGSSTSHLRTSALGGASTYRAWAGVDESGRRTGRAHIPALRTRRRRPKGVERGTVRKAAGQRGRRHLCDVVPHLCRAPPAAAGHRVFGDEDAPARDPCSSRSRRPPRRGRARGAGSAAAYPHASQHVVFYGRHVA
jgi:hypothetical protein